ncbi:hypothetical protein FBU30_010511 [Linnemannia zychae]|nr:hypothetical protein FBU30_010511 [Linnemannia zychae]
MAYVTPHIRNNNSIRLSLNSTTSFNQPPQQDQVELYEKGYYVPESTLRNPQYCIDDVGNLAGDTVEPLSGSIWMTPRRNPQDLSQHHLLVRSGSNMEITTKPGEESESGNRFDPTLCKGSTYDQPMYHEAQSEYSNVRVGDK